MKIIGITGGIGSGKSQVLSYMKEQYHVVVCETDKIAHKLQMPGEECYQEIVKCFGDDILQENQQIDRKVLGAIVFNDEGKLHLLNKIVHPAVKADVKRQIEDAGKKCVEIVLVESALLQEDHYEEICDEIWYIYAEESVRRERLKLSRNLSEEKISSIIKLQADEETFRNYCQVMIDNSGTFECTKEQIEKAVSRR